MDFDKALELYEPVIGFEVHVELNTKTKMFSPRRTPRTRVHGAEPNTLVDARSCLGLPGSLPVVNGEAVRYSITLGLALGCSIAAVEPVRPEELLLPRPREELPDLAVRRADRLRGLGRGRARRRHASSASPIERAHMEEDAGKLTHVGGSTGRIQGAEYSLVDYNRAGVPLVEIVTKPIYGAEHRAPEIAKAYVADDPRHRRSRSAISEARMERGNLRCDANVSLRPRGQRDALGTRTETKNVNSLRSVERAVRYEIQRQAAILADGGTITRRPGTGTRTPAPRRPGRPKSDADDYRYFPEPDLLPVAPSRELVEELRAALPEPPAARRRRLKADWGFTDLEFQDVVNAGLLAEVDETVAAGASAGRRAQVVDGRDRPAREREPTSMPAELVTPGRRRGAAGARSTPARSTTSWPARCSRASIAGEGTPSRSSTPAASRSSPTTAR